LKADRLESRQAASILTLSLSIAWQIPAARAHDFWLEPEKFRPAVGERVALRLRVGENWKGEPVAYLEERIVRFVSAGPGGEQRIAGTQGADPAGSFTVTEPGLQVVGYHSKNNEVRFDSFDRFEYYLLQEGLERRLESARKRFDARKSILEYYSRYAKTLIGAGEGKGAADRGLGFPFELIAENNPYGGERRMSVRLLYRGKPLEGVLAQASSKQNPTEKIKVRTDKDGRAVFQLDKPGIWLINAVHLVPASGRTSADWESFWASLTFELP
jgi:uncharacterized GH25 family protein